MTEAPVAALIEPNLRATEDRTLVLTLYARRIFELEQPDGYAALFERRSQFLEALGTAHARSLFVLRGWRVAPARDWGAWAEILQLTEPQVPKIEALVLAITARTLQESAALSDVPAIEGVSGAVAVLAPALGALDDAEQDRLEEAAREALAGSWWDSEEAMALQSARHSLIRSVEEIAPAASEGLAGQRSADVAWPIDEEVEIDLVVLRGWRQMGEELEGEAYERALEAIPAFDRESRPQAFADALATRAVLMRDGGYAGGHDFIKARLAEMRDLAAMGSEYSPTVRVAATACLDLGPTSGQVTRLLGRIGREPSEQARNSVRRWAEAHGRGPTATLIKELMPMQVAGDWMPVLRECDYEELPVLRRLREVLLKDDNTVERRAQFAGAMEALGLRTKGAPDKVAKLIVDLLNPKRKRHRRNDLRVALILCSCLGSAHDKQAQIGKVLIAYSKKWDCQYTPTQNEAILEVGVSLPEEYLSKKARKGLQEAAEAVTGRAGRAISKLNPFS